MVLSLVLIVTPLGISMGALPIRDMVFGRPRYQTLQTSSPPTPFLRAARSVIIPCDVLMIMMPSPLRTFGMSVHLA